MIERGRRIFKKLLVAVTDNPAKQPLFTTDERLTMLRELTTDMSNVVVDSFQGLAVEYVRSQGTNIILRGIRTISDFEYEFQMALTNRAIAPDLETVFVMTCEKFSYFSSHLIKEGVTLGADVRAFVPANVEAMLKKKLARGVD